MKLMVNHFKTNLTQWGRGIDLDYFSVWLWFSIIYAMTVWLWFSINYSCYDSEQLYVIEGFAVETAKILKTIKVIKTIKW